MLHRAMQTQRMFQLVTKSLKLNQPLKYFSASFFRTEDTGTNHQLTCSIPHPPIVKLHTRQFSSYTPEEIKFLSDIEEHVQRDFTYKDIEKQIESSLPALTTTEKLLQICETTEDVLREIKIAAIGGKLWKDELLYYFRALHNVNMKKKRQFEAEHTTLPDDERIPLLEVVLREEEELLDDPYFQHLLQETLTHASRFTSRQLTNLFWCFVRLQIPPSSNVMSLLVVIMQNRINDFFPEDVLSCLNTLRIVGFHNSKTIKSFEKGLFMHLENLSVDDITFTRVLMSVTLVGKLRLLKYVSVKVSDDIIKTIKHTCYETIKQRPHKGLNGPEEMSNVLRTLLALDQRDRFLLRATATFVRDNKGALTEHHKQLIKTSVEQLHIEDKLILRRLKLPDLENQTNEISDSEDDGNGPAEQRSE